MNRKQRRAASKGGAGSSAAPLPDYLQAHQHHRQGNLEAAHAHYLRALAKDPDHAGCLMGLGLVAFSRRLFDQAEDLLRRAHEAGPGDGSILANLAAALLERGKFGECAAACERALELQPDNYEALTNLSFAQTKLGQPARAADLARRAVALRPESANAHIALGTALTPLALDMPGAGAEAIAALQKGRAIQPGNALVDLNLAGLMVERSMWREAREILTEGVQRHPAKAGYYRLLARTLLGEQDHAAALEMAQMCCELEPGEARPIALKAQVLLSMKRHEEALEAAETALAIDPGLTALKLDVCQIRQLLAAWDGLAEAQGAAVTAMIETEAMAGPFHLLSMPEPAGSADNQLKAAQIYQKRAAAKAGLDLDAVREPARHGRRTGRPLKIGYLSNDFCEHATASLIAELIERHDRARFEVSAYCYSADDGSAFRQRLLRSFDRFVDIKALSLDAAAERIRDDGIDILVDLKGFTQGSRSSILQRRPAPIQVNFLGYPGTLGSPLIDYIIGDAFLTPMASQPSYAERIVQLPHCYQPNDTRRPVDRTAMRRQDHGLPADAFVFCSFNNVNKLTREVFGVWMRLLQQVPNAVLWLLARNATVERNLVREAAACGIDGSRLVFAHTAALPTHIARMRLADLFLDSFPCTAHTTASEALWAGLPLVTCAGETFASRVAGSILTAGGLADLVTTTLQDYEALALRFATDAAYRSDVKARAACAGGTPLFDIARYTRDLEAAYLKMAEQHDAGEAPAAFAVRDLPRDENPTTAETARTDMTMHLSSQVRLANADNDAGGTGIEAKVKYAGCPLCSGTDIASLGETDCSGHALYRAPLPSKLTWCFCESCRHVFADGRYSEQARAILHPRTPAAELAGHDLERQRIHSAKLVKRVTQHAAPGVWLDVGFGNGSLLFTAEEWGYRAVGLDVRPDNVQAMLELGFEAHLTTIEGFQPQVPCSVISMTNVLQYVAYPAEALKAASAMLSDDGVMLLVMPNMDTMAWRRLDQQRANPAWADLEVTHHFTRQRLYQLLLECGLMPLEYDVSERHPSAMEVLAVKLPPATDDAQ